MLLYHMVGGAYITPIGALISEVVGVSRLALNNGPADLNNILLDTQWVQLRIIEELGPNVLVINGL